ncbi:MAG: ergothioneine biosynthesis protein EgtB [Candidatus Rokuibacteriota bacterium]
MVDTRERYEHVRTTTERLCAPLATEDYVVQAMPDVSPARWHLAHTSWFFETFLLQHDLSGYQPLDTRYHFLFNSYYHAVGPQHARPERGHLSRPTVEEVYAYRAHVDKAMSALLHAASPEIADLVTLGLNHEQQHQELLVTDIKYNLAVNPLRPAYAPLAITRGTTTAPVRWLEFDAGVEAVGHDGSTFSFDNERPRHLAYAAPCRLASRLVTNGEYRNFLEDAGYRRPELWLSDGWNAARAGGWEAPLYWERRDGAWWTYTLAGPCPLDEHAPVVHVSYFEAEAFARWAGRRLPTEQEWERAARHLAVQGNFQEHGVLEPLPATAGGLAQMFGDAWEWTQSAYLPYPGFRPLGGAVGEYNGKFMVNQMVLRGGSCATPASHIRATYRNFFPPHARWQFSSIRLAEDR